MIRGGKSTEFYVVIVIIALWGAKYLGLDLSTEQIHDSAVTIAEQLQGIDDTSDVGAWVGALYVAGRSVIKLIDRGKNDKKD